MVTSADQGSDESNTYFRGVEHGQSTWRPTVRVPSLLISTSLVCVAFPVLGHSWHHNNLRLVHTASCSAGVTLSRASWVAKHLTWTPSYFAGIQTPHGRHCPKWPGTDQVSHPTVRLGILGDCFTSKNGSVPLSWRKCPGFSVKSMDAVFEISTWISTVRRRTQAIGPETSMASLLKHVGTSSMSQKSGPDPGSIDGNVIIGETRCPSPHESEKWSRPESSSSKPD